MSRRSGLGKGLESSSAFAKNWRKRHAARGMSSRSLRFEPLEERRLLAITVTTLIDENDGAGVGGVSLRDAIAAATPGETIDFAPALFNDGPAAILLTHGELVINKDLTISGPNSSLLTIDASGNDPTPELKDGAGSRVFNIEDFTSEARNVSLIGLTLTGGDSQYGGGAIRSAEKLTLTSSTLTGNYSVFSGGGLYVIQGEATVAESMILNNRTATGGGGILASSAKLTVANSTISGNKSVFQGGGISGRYSQVSVDSTSFTYNQSLYGGGGAIGVSGYGTKLELTNSTLTGNTASTGGAIYASGGTTLISASTLGGNSAQSGGGIRAWSTALEISDSSVINNNSSTEGGGLNVGYSTTKITRTLISSNQSIGGGGGINTQGWSGSLEIADSTISLNNAGGVSAAGGGISARYSQTTITNSVITGNTTTGNGGGIAGRYLTIDRSVISLNSTPAQGGGIWSANALAITNSSIHNNVAGSGGGIYARDGAVSLNGTTISSNSAETAGALRARNANLYITNSTVSGNTATNSAGGLYLFSNNANTFTIKHSTIVQNSSGTIGGGILAVGGALSLDHTILATNTASFARDIAAAFGTAVAHYSFIGDNTGSNFVATPANSTDANGNRIGPSVSNGPLNVSIDLAAMGDFEAGVNGDSFLFEYSVDGGPFQPLFTSSVDESSSQVYFMESGTLVSLDDPLLMNEIYLNKYFQAITATIDNSGSQIRIRFTATNDGPSEAFAWRNLFLNKVSTGQIVGGAVTFDVTQDLFDSYQASADYTVAGDMFGIRSRNAQGTPSLPFDIVDDSWSIFPGDLQGIISQFDTTRFFGVVDTVNGVGSNTNTAQWTFSVPLEPLDPMLAQLADNGGLLLPDGSRLQTHAPLTGSPIIDTGKPSAIPGNDDVPLTDQRGISLFSRVADGDGDGLPRIDIGAYEQQSLALVVDTLADEDDGDFSAGDLSLREAIELSNGNPVADTIEFDPTLRGGTILLTQGTLSIWDSVAIHGPGADLLTIDATGSDPTPFDNLGDGSGVFRVESLVTSIDGLTLTGADSFQGAIYSSGDFTISNSHIFGNSSMSDGGGITQWSGHLTVNNSRVTGNSSWHGGGIAARYADVSINDSVISGNVATFGNGGGVDLRGGSLSIVKSVISSNSAYSGGGISAVGLNGPFVIESSVVSENIAKDGGGINLDFGSIEVKGSSIRNNTATTGKGGGLKARAVSMSIVDSTINFNSANSGGGIWYNGYAGATIINSTISGNSATASGGNLYSFNKGYLPLTIRHSTITNGYAGFGGGIFAPTGLVVLDHTIVAQNSAALGPDITGLIGLTVSARYSLIGINSNSGLVEAPLGSPDANGNLIGGPIGGTILARLSPLAHRGGPLLPDGSGLLTHGLQSGSPALDAGDPTAVAGSGTVPEFDERGAPFARVVAINSANPARIDIGAVEAQPLTYVVDTLADETDGDYSLGDLSLREAIFLANENGAAVDVITFSNTLTGGTILLIWGQFLIQDSVKIIGLGDDALTVDASGSDFTPDTDDGFGSRIFEINDFNEANSIDVEISGLKLTGADTFGAGGAIVSSEKLTLIDATITGNAANSAGGGIFQSTGGALTMTGVVVSHNASRYSGGGGGLYCASPTTITNSTITSNKATGSGPGGGIRSRGIMSITGSTISGNTMSGSGSGIGGGGIYSTALGSANSLTVVDSVVSNNSTTAGEGGGIRKRGGTLVVQGSTISGNSARVAGGGISAADNGVSAQITASTIDGNAVTGPSYGGGGAFIFNGALTVTGSTISGNSSRGGAGVYGRQAKINVVDSTISGNNAGNNGGGLLINSTLANPAQGLSVINSTVSGNSAVGRGGGIYNQLGLTTIQFSTITNNSAGLNFGGGIGSHAVATARTEVRSTIVSGNTNGDVQFVTGNTNSFLSNGYNLIGAGNGGAVFNKPGDQTGIVNALLGPLVNNGGPTKTHALLAGSPAIDAGDPSAIAGVGGVPTFDQRGTMFGRVLDANYFGGPHIDIGAYELAPPTLLGDYNGNGTVEIGDYIVWRKLLGTNNPIADGTKDGIVDQADYMIWRAHFGQSILSGAAAGSSADLVTQEVAAAPTSASASAEHFAPSAAVFVTELPVITHLASPYQSTAIEQRPAATSPLAMPLPAGVATRSLHVATKSRRESRHADSHDSALTALLAQDLRRGQRFATVGATVTSPNAPAESEESCGAVDAAFADDGGEWELAGDLF